MSCGQRTTQTRPPPYPAADTNAAVGGVACADSPMILVPRARENKTSRDVSSISPKRRLTVFIHTGVSGSGKSSPVVEQRFAADTAADNETYTRFVRASSDGGHEPDFDVLED